MKEMFKRRIGYKGELRDISEVICKDFNLGDFKSNDLVLVGYEDFNFVLETSKDKYFVKIYANFRTDKDCERCVDIILKAIEAKVQTPKLLKSKQGYLHKLEVNGVNLRLCVLEYIEGKNLFQLKQRLNKDEIKFIAKQAALINSIDIKPEQVYDSWAIVNFLEEYNEKVKYLTKEDLELVKPLIEEFKELNIKDLPHCFVHGDIFQPNVMKENDKLWIIDFAVSNYYPRIQELAVLGCNLLFDPKSKKKSEENLNIALKEYQKKIKLTEKELKALPTYIKLAHAMYIIEASHAKVAQNSISEEDEYWLEQGRLGLKE